MNNPFVIEHPVGGWLFVATLQVSGVMRCHAAAEQ
jgi:hypothetical protein